MDKENSNSRLIYSTSSGRICPECSRPVKNCACSQIRKSIVADREKHLKIVFDTKGRKGKGMTVISGLNLNENGLLGLARKLKQRFGTGGSVKEGNIEIQGDFRTQVKEELLKLNYKL